MRRPPDMAEEWAEVYTADHVIAEQIMIEARADLLARGVDEAEMVSPIDPAGAVLLAEAANLAAKFDGLYGAKVAIGAVISELPSVEAGWGEDGAYHMYADGAGAISYHDPFGDLWYAASRRRKPPQSVAWSWSGIRRQHLAFLALRHPEVRRLLAEATDPYGAGTMSDDAVERAVADIMSA